MKTSLNKIGIALFAVCIFAGHASAQLCWVGTAANPMVAGNGIWDNSTPDWSTSPSANTMTVWNSDKAISSAQPEAQPLSRTISS